MVLNADEDWEKSLESQLGVSAIKIYFCMNMKLFNFEELLYAEKNYVENWMESKKTLKAEKKSSYYRLWFNFSCVPSPHDEI